MKNISKSFNNFFSRKKGPDHLSRMPDTVMMGIFDYCDFLDIHSLRNTCHYLRDFIDDVQPDSEITYMRIVVNNSSIFLKFHGGKRSIYLEYRKNHSVINVRTKKKKSFKNQDFREKFCEDLGYILRLQKTKIHHLSVVVTSRDATSQFYSQFGTFLKLRPRPLSVKKLVLEIFNETFIMAVLPYFQEEKLETVTIEKAMMSSEQLSPDKIFELNQFKKAKELNIQNFFVDGFPIQQFCHFESLNLEFEKIRINEILIMKQTFLDSPTPQLYRFNFESFPEAGQLIADLGPPHINSGQNWLIKIPNSHFAVFIRLISNEIKFQRVPMLNYSLEKLMEKLVLPPKSCCMMD